MAFAASSGHPTRVLLVPGVAAPPPGHRATAADTRYHGLMLAPTLPARRRPSTQPNAHCLAECAAMNRNHFTGREGACGHVPTLGVNFDRYCAEEG